VQNYSLHGATGFQEKIKTKRTQGGIPETRKEKPTLTISQSEIKKGISKEKKCKHEKKKTTMQRMNDQETKILLVWARGGEGVSKTWVRTLETTTISIRARIKDDREGKKQNHRDQPAKK